MAGLGEERAGLEAAEQSDHWIQAIQPATFQNSGIEITRSRVQTVLVAGGELWIAAWVDGSGRDNR